MEFQVSITPLPPPAAEQVQVTWALVKADGEVIARSPRVWGSEKEARSQIASAKKSMKGAMRCKVVTLR